ncbi:putative molybdenum carrier protein [Ruegeria arenilitoris]|uniref:putative molybdenum carrier protein n=1 Tax=Ruegeria arenilitoris TaxID=1173585 RepID=UPI00147DE700
MKIVSGGQTGVDMSALEFAVEHSIPCEGWVPNGRTNEAGKIPDYIPGLKETDTDDVIERTRLNVATSDATLVFIDGSTSPGTDKTIVFARELGKSHLVVDVRDGVEKCARAIRSWLLSTPVSVLNIAGPRKSEAPQIGELVKYILGQCLTPDKVFPLRGKDL